MRRWRPTRATSKRASRDALFDGEEHLVAEAIDLVERRVHVRRNANARELGVIQSRGRDLVVVPEPAGQLAHIEAIDVEDADRAVRVRAHRGEEVDAVALLRESLRPPITEHAEAGDLSISTDAPVERESDGNRIVDRDRVCSDLLVLSNVVDLVRPLRIHRPEILDVVAANVEQAGS